MPITGIDFKAPFNDIWRPMRVLIAEDESKVRKFITEALKASGMVVDSVASLSELTVALKTGNYDAVVLDRMLEGQDSLDELPRIHKELPNTKVLILSALADVEDKVKGLTRGADDYLGKPFHVAELIARLRTLSRRTDQTAKGTSDSKIEYGDLAIDLSAQKVVRSGTKIELTGKEFRTLCVLAKNPGQVFSKTQLLDRVWDINHSPESNVVEVTIANLRSKLDKNFKPLIHSKRGVGYWLGEE